MAVDVKINELISEAERLGKEQMAIDEKNRRRRAKGRKPLLDEQEKKDREVLLKKYRTGDPTVVDGDDALSLYRKRKAEMDLGDFPDDDEEDDVRQVAVHGAVKMKVVDDPRDAKERRSASAEQEEAIRQAAAARRVEDLKSGRIDHAGNWSDGQKLEGGDGTRLPRKVSKNDADGGGKGTFGADGNDPEPTASDGGSQAPLSHLAPVGSLEEFRRDLYERLRVSFEGLEVSMSDLQGRVAEIVTASASVKEDADISEKAELKESDDKAAQFEQWLSTKTPIVFDVGGTKMTFDAICVFHAPPCLTIVSKIDSAKVSPKPGSQLKLTYFMDGKRYVDDPVTFLGTRFDLPMFGLSFVGFIRDIESDMMDVDQMPKDYEESLPVEPDAG